MRPSSCSEYVVTTRSPASRPTATDPLRARPHAEVASPVATSASADGSRNVNAVGTPEKRLESATHQT